ncbi:Protein unc-79-like [Cricetulus griseus]|uniref:Protein unc-79-like n=1 Tax=Cricetulus griseus TaxID=10029 RepID=G3HU82_CRIGR|nr:Protein unc-79-like [Cricetulus griseus]
MKFMAKDESSAESDISSAKAFNTVKRHLYVLLGYDQQEGCFMIAPQKMRLSTCFNAFIAGIAQVMDYNINLGKHLLPLVVQVLKYCSCPQLRHYFQQPPRCSLWSLKPHIRQMWLKALLVILYKCGTAAMECIRQYVSEVLDFMADMHTLTKLKTCVLHMCSLFHAFIFAQLWTVYCEQSAVATNVQNQNEFSFTAILTALEFWSRVTPSILQLMAHNKVVSS